MSIERKHVRNHFLRFIIIFSLILLVKPDMSIKHKVSTVNILFPLCEIPLNSKEICPEIVYSVKGYNACYLWSFQSGYSGGLFTTIKNEIKIIGNENNGCVDEIKLVSVVKSHYFGKDVSADDHLWLVATDPSSNHQTKIRIGFSTINSIAITKRFDVINVDEITELDLIAFDEKNNQFSTLEGLTFNWNFKEKSNSLYASLTKLSDEDKFSTIERQNIEKKGYYSDLILIKGLESGTINIQAELVDFSQLKTKSIKSEFRNIIVIEPFRLHPNEIFLLRYDQYNFNILRERVKYEYLKRYEISNENFCSLDNYITNNKSSIIDFKMIFNSRDYSKYNWNLEKIDSNSKLTCGEILTKQINNEDKKKLEYISYKAHNSTCITNLAVIDNRSNEYLKSKSRINVVDPDSLQLGIRQVESNELTKIFNNLLLNKDNLDSYIKNLDEGKLEIENLNFENNEKKEEGGWFSFSLTSLSNSNSKKESKPKIEINDEIISFLNNILNENIDKDFKDIYSFDYSNEWRLVEGRYYLIKHEVMYSNNKIEISNNSLGFEIFSSDKFENFKKLQKHLRFHFCLNDKRMCLVQAIKSTVKDSNKNQHEQLLLASSTNTKLKEMKPNEISLKNEKSILIFKELKIQKFNQNYFVLPYVFDINLELKKGQELNLIVNGGSGHYKIIDLRNNEVLTIEGIKIFSNSIGSTLIKVVDTELENNYDTMEIKVKSITDIIPSELKKEIYLGDNFDLNYIAFNDNEKFSNCTILFNENLGISGFNKNLNDNDSYPINYSDGNTKKIIKENPLNYEEYANYHICDIKYFSTKLIKTSNHIEFSVYYSTSKESDKYYSNLRPLRTNQNTIVRIYQNLSMDSLFTDNFSLKLFQYNSQNILASKKSYLSIAPQTSKNVLLLNGSDKWEDEKFNFEIKIINDAKELKFHEVFQENENQTYIKKQKLNKLNEISKSGIQPIEIETNVKKSLKSLNFKCNEILNINLIVDVIFYNSASKNLKNPLYSEFNFELSCTHPKNLGMYFINQINDENSSNIFTFPQKRMIEYIFKKDSIENLRIYGFDSKMRLMHTIVNYEKINYLNNYNYLIFDTLPESRKNRNSIFSSMTDEYFERSLVFSNFNLKLNQTELIINEMVFDIFDYIDDESQKELLDHIILKKPINNLSSNSIKKFTDAVQGYQSCKVKIVNFPTIFPKEKTITHWSDFSFIIHNGSGSYNISYKVLKTINNKDEKLAEKLPNIYISETKDFDSDIINQIKNDKAYTEKGFINVSANKDNINQISFSDHYKIIIYLEDKNIPNYKTSSILYVSGIEKIILSKDSIVMESHFKNVEFKFLSYFNTFINIKHINHKLNIVGFYFNSFPTSNQLELYSSNNNEALNYNSLVTHSEYSIKAHLEGLYSFNSCLKFNNVCLIESNYIRFEVFQLISIYPPYLLMIPGSSFTVSITKGPSTNPGIKKEFILENDKLGFVEQEYPVVHALRIGITKLTVKYSLMFNKQLMYSNKNDHENTEEILFEESIPVEIAFPEKAEILLGSNRKIFKNSTIRLLSVLKKEGRLFTFTVGPVYYEWITDQPLIAKLKTKFTKKNCCGCNDSNNSPPIYSSNGLVQEENICSSLTGENYVEVGNNIGIFVSSISKGEARISCKVIIDYPDPYKSHLPKEFVTSEKLLVDDNLWISISEFYDFNSNKSGIYLLPFNVSHELKTNRVENNLNFKKINTNESSKDLFSLTNEGRITTNTVQGISQVLIDQKYKTEAPFVPVVLSIYVTEFYSIFIDRSFVLLDIDVGQEQDLKVILQHEFGLLFASKLSGLKLKVVSSHPMIASAFLIEHNNLIRIKAFTTGKAMIILYNPDTLQVYDSFQIHSHASLIMPTQFNIIKGGEIKFLYNEPQRKLMLNNNSEWISSDHSVFYMGNSKDFEKLGTGIANNEGTSTIMLIDKHSQKMKLKTTVNVFQIKKIFLDYKSIPEYITNYKKDRNFQIQYRVKLDFYINDDVKLTYKKNDNLNLISQNIQHQCLVEESQLKLIKTESYVNALDEYFCIIYTNEITESSHRNPKNINLIVKILGSKLTNNETSSSLENFLRIPFNGSFNLSRNFITLDDYSKETISINTGMNDLNYDIITIFNSDNKDNNETETVINSKVISPLNVVFNTIEENYTNFTVSISNKSENLMNSSFKLRFIHKITNQIEECFITYKASTSKSTDKIIEDDSEKTFLFLKWRDIFDLLTVAFVLLAVIIMFKYWYQNDNVNVYNQYDGKRHNSSNINFNSSLNNPYLTNNSPYGNYYSYSANKKDSGNKYGGFNATNYKN